LQIPMNFFMLFFFPSFDLMISKKWYCVIPSQST
jgi:hypothetical protein